MNVLLRGAFGEHGAEGKGERVTSWRKRRQGELERGEDAEAIMTMLEERQDAEPMQVLWAFIFTGNKKGDAGILAMRELMANLITQTLDFEQAKLLREGGFD